MQTFEKRFYIYILALWSIASSFTISSQDARLIAEKIWRNECAGTVEGLTHWNQGENFGSFGIGHFIWYPIGVEERFQETFPELLAFLRESGVKLPVWLQEALGCPWHTREEFYCDIQSAKMAALRQLLMETREQQAIFIAKRLERALGEMQGPPLKAYQRLVKDSRGLYALIDYMNFKGAGTSPAESYKGEGWGLLQVLQGMPLASHRDVIEDFVEVAGRLLKRRVENSPPERNEVRWLPGWLNRVNSYILK
jgi:hypothetical protein